MLARGLLEDLSAREAAGDDAVRKLRLRLEGLDRRIVQTAGQPDLPAEERDHQQKLIEQRRKLLGELARDVSDPSRRQVLPSDRIQASLPDDAALVLWFDVVKL